MVVRDRTFESLAHHTAAHYELVDLTGAKGWQRLSRKPRLAFTFDDGWLDNARTAFPVTRRYNIPLTIFICPDRLGKEFPFRPERAVAAWRAAGSSSDASRKIAELLARLHLAEIAPRPADGPAPPDSLLEALKKLPTADQERLIGQMERIVELGPGRNAPRCVDATMSWTDVAALAAAGVTFGSHTQSHEILPQIPPTEAQRELAESKQVIQQKLQRECLLFAYPNGDCSSEVRDLVARAGYRLAFLNQAGAWTKECDPFLIPRVNIWEGSLLGPSGRFSRVVFEYTVFWKAYRAAKRVIVQPPSLTFGGPTAE